MTLDSLSISLEHYKQLVEEVITMINQPWAKRNWYTWPIAYTSGTNDKIITLGENTQTIDLNQVISWYIRKREMESGHVRLELQVTLTNGKVFSLYDDRPKNIFQTKAFFKAMADAKLLQVGV